MKIFLKIAMFGLVLGFPMLGCDKDNSLNQEKTPIKTRISGGAWLTKKSGSSEVIRGLRVYILRDGKAIDYTQTDVDGKYSIEVEEGDYVLSAIRSNPYSVVTWKIPIKVRGPRDIVIDLHNDNTESILQ